MSEVELHRIADSVFIRGETDRADGLLPDSSLSERVEAALEMVLRYGGIDGSHHKDWVLDQVVRVLTGPAYGDFVSQACDGDDGPGTYSWDTGLAP